MPKDLESDRSPMSISNFEDHHPHIKAMHDEFRRHKAMWGALGVAVGVAICVVCVIASGQGSNNNWHAAGKDEEKTVKGDFTVTLLNPDDGTVASSSTVRATQSAASAGGYCLTCSNAPYRGLSWAFGYGKCVCYQGWSGTCCDAAANINDKTYGPYSGGTAERGGSYQMYTLYSKDVATQMYYPNCAGYNAASKTNVPPEFSGLWWMDGNPASDYVASFGRSKWQTVASGYSCKSAKLKNEQNDQEYDCLGGMDINVYDDRIWSWHDETMGRLTYQGALGTSLTYRFECGNLIGGKLSFCQIYPNAAIPITAGGFISVPPSLVSFDMTRGDDNLWVRNSIIAGLDSLPHNYYLKQIVKCDGKPGQHWNDFLSGGTAKVSGAINDVFGFGKDTRTNVGNVAATQLLSKKI